MTIYLDHAATAPLRPEVLEQMLPHLTGEQANPSSPHGPGRRARMALDEAHERLGRAIGSEARGIVFTSGGTEAINLAVKGAAWAGKAEGHRIITSAIEHKAVLDSCIAMSEYTDVLARDAKVPTLVCGGTTWQENLALCFHPSDKDLRFCVVDDAIAVGSFSPGLLYVA